MDRSVANGVADLLHRHTIPVWYSSTEILGAQQWHDEIGRALKRCDWFVVLLSPNSVVSPWVKRELMFALKEQRYADKIIPVLIKPCDSDQLSWTLSSLQVVNSLMILRTGAANYCGFGALATVPSAPMPN